MNIRKYPIKGSTRIGKTVSCFLTRGIAPKKQDSYIKTTDVREVLSTVETRIDTLSKKLDRVFVR